jgi:hypothetical protein
MDGMGKLLPHEPVTNLPSYLLSQAEPEQATLRSPIECLGTGVHSGRRVAMTLRPAEADTGIVFRRTDLPGAAALPTRRGGSAPSST